MEKIAIVGMGTMGSAMGDLLQDYQVTGIRKEDALDQIQTADAVILAVKPQTFLPNRENGDHGLADQLWPHITDKQRIISIMAGVSIDRMTQLLGTKHVVRTMPNTANSLIAWHTKDKSIDDEALRGLFRHWGTNIRLQNENQFDIFTATAGSGPAFLLLMAEVMEQELVRHGFTAEQAHQVAVRTLESTADLAKSGKSFDTLIRSIMSKGGTTEAGMEHAKAFGFRNIVRGIFDAARRRSEELGR